MSCLTLKENLFDINNVPDKKQDYWSVVKGISILAIVINHTPGPLVNFAYLFDIVIFFFVSGFLYRKTGTLKEYIVKKIKSLWVPFFAYGTLYIIIEGVVTYYTKGRLDLSYSLTNFLYLFTFQTFYQALLAFWFLPVLFFAMIVYDMLHRILDRYKKGELYLLVSIFILGVLGYYLVKYNLLRPHYIRFPKLEISLLILPIIYTAEIVKKNAQKVRFNTIVFVLTVVFLYICAEHYQIRVDLVRFTTPILPLFYLVSFAGIYMVLYVSSVVVRSKKVKRIFVIMGENSFHIMALHYLGLKPVNFLERYISTIPTDNPFYFLHGVNLWVLSAISGVTFSLAVIYTYRKVRQKIVKEFDKKTIDKID